MDLTRVDRSRTQSKRPLIKCTVSVTTIWRAYRAILGNSLSRLNLRYQTTVSVPHNIDAAFFPKPTHSPCQPETPSKMGVPAYQPETPLKKGVPLSRAPIEKETLVEKETLDIKLSSNPPYMLGRDYQASARRAFTLSVLPCVRLICPIQTCPTSLLEPCLKRLPTPSIHSPHQQGESSSC